MMEAISNKEMTDTTDC